MLVATKVTGSQVVEVTVMAYVLSTRSGMQKQLTSPLFKENQLRGNNSSIGLFFSKSAIYFFKPLLYLYNSKRNPSMCYHIIQSKLRKQIERRFKAKFIPESTFEPSTHLNGFDFPSVPIITNDKTEIIQSFKWGFIPDWSKSKDIRALTLNGKIETLHEKPSFKNVIQQRCLVLANGFYEWQWRDSKGKNKVKYQIGIEDEALFAFAGLYSHWHDEQTNEIVKTFTIVTTEANPLMAAIHNIKKRMPVILRPDDEINWLHQEPVDQFAYPYEVNLVAKNLDVQNELLLF